MNISPTLFVLPNYNLAGSVFEFDVIVRGNVLMVYNVNEVNTNDPGQQ